MSTIAGRAISMAFEKLDEHVIRMAEQKVIDTLSNCDSDHNRLFVLRVTRNARRDLLAFILEDDT